MYQLFNIIINYRRTETKNQGTRFKNRNPSKGVYNEEEINEEEDSKAEDIEEKESEEKDSEKKDSEVIDHGA
ncbi:hypothetical protein F8M41_007511 [Gigaspora margarita]|uniref:Uncharacterized protein n=1 Tax=Gigaspora margarita TaxID=4874 RepID=A0A8H4ER69_GIGMA|nr:hypothetical protein F8M41_007511 [Gigaspora margarita]